MNPTRRSHRWNAGAIIVLTVVATPVLAAAQVGGSSRAVTAPVPSAAPLTPAEFRRADVQSRRSIMRAWAYGSPHTAGATLLPILEAGLQDADKGVRHYAVGVLQRVASEANLAAATNKPVNTQPRTYPALYQTLLRLIDHQDTAFRAAIVGALTALAAAPNDALDDILLSRLATEVPYVRARIVTALAERANDGSAKARAAVLISLDDPDLGVRMSATMAMRLVRAPEALRILLRQMETAEEQGVRKAAVQVLAAYGDLAKPYTSVVQARLTREGDPVVRAELQRLMSGLNPNWGRRTP